MKLFLKKIHKLNQGYTIIETMISISIFLVVVMTGMGVLLNANAVHRKSQTMRSILDNLSFIMEDMSRNLRTGYNYHCFVSGDTIPSSDNSPIMDDPKSCASGWGIAFEYAFGDPDPGVTNDQWVYYIDGTGKLFKSTQGPYILSNFVQLTPNEVVVNTTASSFSILGAEAPVGNQQQPFVIIRLVGTVTINNIATPFSLQTAVSQRLIDV